MVVEFRAAHGRADDVLVGRRQGLVERPDVVRLAGQGASPIDALSAAVRGQPGAAAASRRRSTASVVAVTRAACATTSVYEALARASA